MTYNLFIDMLKQNDPDFVEEKDLTMEYLKKNIVRMCFNNGVIVNFNETIISLDFYVCEGTDYALVDTTLNKFTVTMPNFEGIEFRKPKGFHQALIDTTTIH